MPTLLVAALIPLYTENAISPGRLAEIETTAPAALAKAESALREIRWRIPEELAGSENSFQTERALKRLEAAENLVAFARGQLARGDRSSLGLVESSLADLAMFEAYFGDEFAAWKSYPLNPKVKPAVLNVKDFGAVGDGKTSDSAAFQKAVAAVRKLGGRPCVLKVPAGTYFFTETYGAHGSRSQLALTDLRNVVVDGGSPETTTLLFGVYDAKGVALAGSVNSTLRNFNIHYAETPFCQGLILAKDLKAAEPSITIEWTPGTLKPTDPRYAKTCPNVCSQFTGDAKQIVLPNMFFSGRAEDLGDGRFKVYFDPSYPAIRRGFCDVRVGTYFIIPDRNNSIPFVSAHGATLCNFENDWVRNSRAGAFAMTGGFMNTGWKCRVFPLRPELKLSTNADSFFNARGSHLAHCDFTNMNDDGANCLSGGRQIHAVLKDGRTLRHGDRGGKRRVGDIMQVIRPGTGEIVAQLHVVSSKPVAGSPGIIETVFRERIPSDVRSIESIGGKGLTSGEYKDICHGKVKRDDLPDNLYSPMSAGVGFVCLDNHFGSLRNIGVQVQCPSALIEGNRIDNISAGMCVSCLMQWIEGPAPYNVVFRNNEVSDVNCAVSVSVATPGTKPCSVGAIRGLRYENNRFRDIHNRKAMSFRCVDGLELVGNTRDGRALTENDCLFDACDNVSFAAKGNTVRGDGVIPFLAITGRPTEAAVRAKVASMAAAGVESFLIYARSGLELEYMGEDWLRLNEWFCDEAEMRGMKIWLYDEYNWPSGTCKGRVPQENEAWRYREAGVFADGKGGYRWEEACGPAGWVNIYEPGATDRFIELTHEVYAKRLKRWFGNRTILGIFTDEPGHMVKVDFPSGKPLATLRVYGGLEADYRARTGRELKRDVEAFVAKPTPATKKVWEHYAALLGARFRSMYFDKLCAWCDAHGILLTGHMIAENSLKHSCIANGDPLHVLRGESLPGMDEIRTAYDPHPGIWTEIEWITYNVARQAILHRGNGGLVELFACGPGDLTPSVLRQIVWMAAFHGIDHYITCMDVMDEKGMVEKHGYLAPAGPLHPWYARHANVFVSEGRVAAEYARKRVSEREVAVRYPNRSAARTAFANDPAPNVNALVAKLELNQFTCRFIGEDEKSDLPLVFVCNPDGTYEEERTGKKRLKPEYALAMCRHRLPKTFEVSELDGSPADDLMLRTYEDGTSAIINIKLFTTRTLVARRGDKIQTFEIAPHGVRQFAAGAFGPSVKPIAESRPLSDAKWTVTRDRPNLLRVNFTSPAASGRRGVVRVAEDVTARPVMRDCAMAYAVTKSGRPIGINEAAPKGETVMRHEAIPYAFAADGERLAGEVGAADLPGVYSPLYRTAKARRWTRGEHTVEIVTGEADNNFFFPALFLAGDFRVFDGFLVREERNAPATFGSFSALGYPNFTGGLTWKATVTAPAGARLAVDTGKCAVTVRFCGADLGACLWAPFEWEIPADLQGRTGSLEITVYSSAEPMFGEYGTPGTNWDMRLWFGEHTPDSACGLFSARWQR